MKNLNFKKSNPVSLGVELEFQIIDPLTFDLISRAKGLIRLVQESKYASKIKPEITQSMIEINSDIHSSANTLYQDLVAMRNFLVKEGHQLGVYITGGGTHPFQKWSLQKIFPTLRYKNLSHQFRYLSKVSTVFGEHIHIGCRNGEEALFLIHALARYIPQLIALSASSPFYQGVDTGYNTCRSTVFNAFPSGGFIPRLLTWQEFSDYFSKMKKQNIIHSMKDFYWDIRPKPEFGTIEIRVCDTPLTIEKAACIAAYIQSLCLYLLTERPHTYNDNLYHFYTFNRFQASRYGYEGLIVDPYISKHIKLNDDILATIKKIEPYAKILNNTKFILQLKKSVQTQKNDALLLRKIYKKVKSLPKVVRQQCMLWKGQIK